MYLLFWRLLVSAKVEQKRLFRVKREDGVVSVREVATGGLSRVQVNRENLREKKQENKTKTRAVRFNRLSHIHHVRWCRCERQKNPVFLENVRKNPVFPKTACFFCRSHLHHCNHERKDEGIQFIVLYPPKCSHDLPSLALRPVHTDTISIPLGIFQSRKVLGIYGESAFR